MKQRIRRQEFFAQVGDQIGGQEKTQTALGEKAERAIVIVQHLRIELAPVCFPDESANLIVSFTTFEGALQKSITWVGSCTECFFDQIDDFFFAPHRAWPPPKNVD